uniref:ATP synthase F0 subunit 8 n=1 Tax=Lucanus prometheus TaxID=618055 RepID=UPI001EDF8207|nr:ATP synthase F0 subunit 8 [Lucanus prometheus]UIN24747.1 ATP synthase F0 subunit 8 [Lucanus prometheus]
MPQMAPLSWLTLMFTFIMTLLIFSLISFSINTPSPQVSHNKKVSFPKTWKW